VTGSRRIFRRREVRSGRRPGGPVLFISDHLPNIGSQPIAGGDEGWIMSASKLAERASSARPLRRLFGADRHYC
jgi:hypothetical protein